MDRLKSLGGGIGRLVIPSGSPDRTFEIGTLVGRSVPAGTVISLEGGLGAGKTLLTKGICRGLDVDEEVTSPSFILAEEYRGVLPLFHFDLYRLEGIEEVERIGLFDAVDGTNIVVVEWGDRLPAGMLAPDVRISMSITGEAERRIEVEAGTELLELLGRGDG